MTTSAATYSTGLNDTDIISADVLLAQQGDVQAYERLIKRCQNLVSSIALAIVKDIDDSEEIAQQVFIAAWQNLSSLKNDKSFLPWIRQSTRYTALNFLRDNKVAARVSSEQADKLLAQIADPRLAEDEQLIIQNQQLVLNSFIDKLADDEREIVLLYYREEQSSKHVAQLLDLSESNVRKKLSRVRQTLKDNMLKRAGHIIYSTAPALGFSAFVSSLIVPSAPAAAATVAATATANSNFIVKLGAIFGGAFIGAFMGIAAVIWSSNTAIKNLPLADHKREFKRYRNELIAWIALFAVSFTLAIQFSAGWLAPILSYSVFIIGYIALMIRQMRFLHQHSLLKQKVKQVRAGQGQNEMESSISLSADEYRKPTLKQRIFAYTCLAIGVLTSAAGAIAGLVGSGRIGF